MASAKAKNALKQEIHDLIDRVDDPDLLLEEWWSLRRACGLQTAPTARPSRPPPAPEAPPTAPTRQTCKAVVLDVLRELGPAGGKLRDILPAVAKRTPHYTRENVSNALTLLHQSGALHRFGPKRSGTYRLSLPPGTRERNR